MNHKRAKTLVRQLKKANFEGTRYELVGEPDFAPTFKEGAHIGTFKFAPDEGPWLKLSVVIWRASAPKEWYLVLASPARPRLAELWEIAPQTAHLPSGDVIWSYSAKHQNDLDRNTECQKPFQSMAGSLTLRVSLPGDDVSVADFLDDVFRLAEIRRAADGNPPEKQRSLKVEYSRNLTRGHFREDISIYRQPGPGNSQAS